MSRRKSSKPDGVLPARALPSAQHAKAADEVEDDLKTKGVLSRAYFDLVFLRWNFRLMIHFLMSLLCGSLALDRIGIYANSVNDMSRS